MTTNESPMIATHTDTSGRTYAILDKHPKGCSPGGCYWEVYCIETGRSPYVKSYTLSPIVP